MIITSKVLKIVAAILVVLLGVVVQPVNATAIDALITFDSDVPGLPPTTGGINQPTSLFASPGTTILVQSSAHGISTQPVVLSADAPGQFATVNYAFEPVASGILRVEATVAFDRLVDGFFLQTSVTEQLAVVTRLISTSAGEIQNNSTRITVGQYIANQPFRVRVDIDMNAKTWSVTIDNELNGFDGNPVVSNLPFENDPSAIPSVGAVDASLSVFPVTALGAAVAYDDIRVTTPTLTVAVAGAGTGVVTSNPSAITCATGNSGTCESDFPLNIPVTLIATPTGGSSFGGWSGDCPGFGSGLLCGLIMDGAKSVTATFLAPPAPPPPPPPPPPSAPGAAVGLSGALFHTGQTIIYEARLTPGPTPLLVDLYLGALLPDGFTFLSLVQSAPGVTAIVLGLSPVPYLASVPLAPTNVLFSHLFTGVEPVGTYFTYAAIAVAGSHPFTEGNQLALGVQAFEFVP